MKLSLVSKRLHTCGLLSHFQRMVRCISAHAALTEWNPAVLDGIMQRRLSQVTMR